MAQQDPANRRAPDRHHAIKPADDYGAWVIDFSPRRATPARSQPIPLPLPVIAPRQRGDDHRPAHFAQGAPRPVALPQPRAAFAEEQPVPAGRIAPRPLAKPDREARAGPDRRAGK